MWLLVISLVAATQAIPDVFHVQSEAGRYRLKSEEEAQTFCETFGARLATRDELEGAYFRGLSVCNCGYVKGGTVTFPQRVPEAGCGYSAGLQYCPKDYQDWGNEGWDAYCARDMDVTCPQQQELSNQVGNFTHYTDNQAVLFPELSFHAAGQVAQWSYYSIRPDVPIYAGVWRHIGYSRYQLVGRNVLPTGRAGFVHYVVAEEDRIRVRKGDFIGVHYDTYLPRHPTVFSSIPYAKAPDNLCSTGGICLLEKDLQRSLVVHRHEQQLTHVKDVVVDLALIHDRTSVDYLSPALSPTLCPDETSDPDDKPCTLPFVYNNKTYDTCIEERSQRAWCATNDEYDGNNWRYCREGDVFPHEQPCHFPFEYQGRNVSQCVSDNSIRPWCSLVQTYNVKDNWRYCRDVNVTTIDVTVTSIQEADEACRSEGLVLAMLRDAEAVRDMGRALCDCAWISTGHAVRVHRGDSCPGATGEDGVDVCVDSPKGYPPLCLEP